MEEVTTSILGCVRGRRKPLEIFSKTEKDTVLHHSQVVVSLARTDYLQLHNPCRHRKHVYLGLCCLYGHVLLVNRTFPILVHPFLADTLSSSFSSPLQEGSCLSRVRRPRHSDFFDAPTFVLVPLPHHSCLHERARGHALSQQHVACAVVTAVWRTSHNIVVDRRRATYMWRDRRTVDAGLATAADYTN